MGGYVDAYPPIKEVNVKYLTILLLVLVASVGWAELEGYQVFPPTTIATNTAAVTVDKAYKVEGVPVRILVNTTAGSTSTVSVATQAGYGTSDAGAQIIYANDSVTADVSSNYTSTVYLWYDRTSCTVSNSWTNDITVEVLLIVDDEP